MQQTFNFLFLLSTQVGIRLRLQPNPAADCKYAPQLEKVSDEILVDEVVSVPLPHGENTGSAEKQPSATTPMKELSVSFKASPAAAVQPMN